jgi:MFS family permease
MLLAPQGLGLLLSLPQAGKLTDRIGDGRLVLIGVLTTLVGTVAFMCVTDTSSYVLLSFALFVRGVGLGATNTPALAAAYRHLTREELPNATTVLNVVQRLGAPLGTATMAVVLQRFMASSHAHDAPTLAHAFAHTFMVSGALGALALFAALSLIRSDPNRRRAT